MDEEKASNFATDKLEITKIVTFSIPNVDLRVRAQFSSYDFYNL